MLEIDHRKANAQTALIVIKGRMMLGENSQQVETTVAALIAEGCRHLVFELSGLTQIDSTGIGRFIAAYRQVMAVGGSLKMAAAGHTVRSAFRVTRLDTVFPFFAALEEALPEAAAEPA